MGKKRIGYRAYGFREDNTLISRMEQFEDYMDKKFSGIVVDNSGIDEVVKESVEEAVRESLANIDCKFGSVHKHIDCAEQNIIKSVEDNSKEICTCHMATKEDICHAVNRINHHIDEKFDEVDFLKQFSDLNEEIRNLKQ